MDVGKTMQIIQVSFCIHGLFLFLMDRAWLNSLFVFLNESPSPSYIWLFELHFLTVRGSNTCRDYTTADSFLPTPEICISRLQFSY